MPKWSPNGAQMHEKSIKNESQKKDEFRELKVDFALFRRGAQFAPVKVNLPAKKPNKTEKVK